MGRTTAGVMVPPELHNKWAWRKNPFQCCLLHGLVVLRLNCTRTAQTSQPVFIPRALGVSPEGLILVFLASCFSFTPPAPAVCGEQGGAPGSHVTTGLEPWDSAVGAGNPLVANCREPVGDDPHFCRVCLSCGCTGTGFLLPKSFSTLKMGCEVALKPEVPTRRFPHVPIGAELG